MLLSILVAVLFSVPSDLATLTVPTVVEAAPDYSTTTLRAYAFSVAKEHNLNADHFVKVIQAESSFKWNAVGDNGTSIGIAQLHYPSAYWGISTSTAFDPYQSIDIMAQAWVRGQQSKWSTWRYFEKFGWEVAPP